jgi:hypothetical protein
VSNGQSQDEDYLAKLAALLSTVPRYAVDFSHGNTFLHKAVHANNLVAAKFLVEKLSLDPRAMQSFGGGPSTTPLAYCARQDDAKFAALQKYLTLEVERLEHRGVWLRKTLAMLRVRRQQMRVDRVNASDCLEHLGLADKIAPRPRTAKANLGGPERAGANPCFSERTLDLVPEAFELVLRYL